MIGAFLGQKLVRVRSATDQLGRIIAEPEVTFRCRAELADKRVVTVHGERIQKVWQIFAAPNADIVENDRIRLLSPSGQVESEWVVRSVHAARGFGLSHLEIEV